MGKTPSKLGRYRVIGPDGEEYAVVHRDAGDGAPYLPRDVYETLDLTPRYDALRLIANDDGVHWANIAR